MSARLLWHLLQRIVFIALPLAIGLIWFLPATSEAHAILLRSDPTRNAVLTAAPSQVRMWFSEDLNPTFSTAAVVNAANQRVDKQDAHVSSGDPREMDITLAPNLPPSAYVVVWRTDSNNDGHILSGSFIFSVQAADGTIPTVNGNTLPGQDLLGGNNSGLYSGQLDGPSSFNLIMITLVELGAVFWVGAQIWLIFVIQPATADNLEQAPLNQQIQDHFDRFFSAALLLVLLLANIGVLIGQALAINGQWNSAFDLVLLTRLATNGRFGTYWLMREIIVMLALLLSLYIVLVRKRPAQLNRSLAWINLVLGLALFLAITMSSHASAVNNNVVIFAILVDWLHLLSAATWVGGMMYIVTSYLPVLRQQSMSAQTKSLLTMLPYYTPWAIAAIVLMAVTGPLSATFHLSSWDQFISTAYGRVLLIKIILVGGLLCTSAVHVFLLRPRLSREYKKYSYAVARVEALQAMAMTAPDAVASTETTLSNRSTRTVKQQVKLREDRLATRTRRLTMVLRWEPLLGIGVLVCVGLMNVFAGTLTPIALPTPKQTTTTPSTAFQTTIKTSDGKFSVALTVSPDRFGPNVFTVTVIDTSTGAATTNVGVSLYTTMLDMDMGTDSVNLQLDGKGHFTGNGDLGMAGHWQVRIQIRTPDNTLHETTVEFVSTY